MHMHMHMHLHLHMSLQVTRLGLERDMLEAEYARMSLGSGRSAAERRRKVEASAYRLTLLLVHLLCCMLLLTITYCGYTHYGYTRLGRRRGPALRSRL